MKRQLIAWILLITLGLQGSPVLAAIPSAMQADCQTAHKPCCPGGTHIMSCCVDVGVTQMAVPMTPVAVAWRGLAALIPVPRAAIFSSRGESPLIRPPIL